MSERVKKDGEEERTIFDLASDEFARSAAEAAIAARRGEVRTEQLRDAQARRLHIQHRYDGPQHGRDKNPRPYATMLELNNSIIGPVKTGEHTEQPGLITRLIDSRMAYDVSTNVFDKEGKEIRGWKLGEVSRAGMAALPSNNFNIGAEPDRFGLLLRSDGTVLQYSMQDGIGTPHYEDEVSYSYLDDKFKPIPNDREIALYDLELGLQPGFVNGREEMVVWDNALAEGIKGLTMRTLEMEKKRSVAALSTIGPAAPPEFLPASHASGRDLYMAPPHSRLNGNPS